MPLQLKEGEVTKDLPTITLADKPYYVARLRLRERIAIAQFVPKVRALLTKMQGMIGGTIQDLSADDYLLMVDVTCLALKRLYPTITRDDLLDEEVEFDELFAAYPTIVKQGTSRRASEGEAEATSLTNTSGESSSPI